MSSIKKLSSIEITNDYFGNKKLKFFGTENDRVCIVYGRNGSGKSTIAKSLNDNRTVLLDSEDKPIKLIEGDEIYVFNNEFINSSISYEKKGLDTIIIMGKQKDIDEQLKEKEKEKSLLEENIKKKVISDTNNNNKLEEVLKSICKKLRGEDSWAKRNADIKNITEKATKKNSNVDNSVVERLSKKEVAKGKSELFEEYNKTYKIYRKISLNGSKSINDKICTDILTNFNTDNYIHILEKKVEKPNLNERETHLLRLTNDFINIDKIKELFLSDIDVCPFCLQDVNEHQKNKVISYIKNILNKEVELHKSELNDLDDNLNKLKEYLDNNKFLKEYDAQLDQYLIRECNKYIEEIYDIIKDATYYIKKKRENIFIQIDNIEIKDKFIFLKKNLVLLKESLIKLKKNITDHNNIVKKINEEENSIKEELMEINDSIGHHDIRRLYNKYNKVKIKGSKINYKLNILEKDFKKIVNEISNLEKEKENVKIAIENINADLAFIFSDVDRLSIEFDLENKFYKIKSRGTQVVPNQISLGERNAIGLSYFFNKILSNKDEEFAYNKSYLIILDDPVSSFDNEIKTGIINYIQSKSSKFLIKSGTKIILMTHDLHVLNDLYYTYTSLKKGEKKNIIKVLKNKNIDPISASSVEQEYTYLMNTIYNFVINNTTEGDSNISIGNVIRKLVEALSTFLYKQSPDMFFKSKNIIDKIDDKYQEYYKYSSYKVFLDNLSHNERNINRINLYRNESQINLAKNILCLIYLFDKKHVIAHLESANEKVQVQQNLEKWIHEIPLVENTDVEG